MIRASRPLTFDQAAAYYRREYTRGDYYTAGKASSGGIWMGRGAARLGLSGEIRHDDFAALLQGRSPHDGHELVAAEAASGRRRAAWDFVVAPDKSVSLLALLGDDPRVAAAHLRASERAISVLEWHALAKDRERRLLPTGNLVIARFDHDSSRALDPQLHSHHVILNLTDRAGTENLPPEWRALEPRGLFAAQSLATAIYHAELARELQALGYEVSANTRGHVRVEGIPETALQAFSKRRRQILAELDRAGAPFDPQRAAHRTRGAKNHDIDPEALRRAWSAEARRLGIDLGGLRQRAAERLLAGCHLPPGDPSQQAEAAVSWAVEHLSERQAAFRLLDLETFALRHAAALGPGYEHIQAALARHAGLIPSRGSSRGLAGGPRDTSDLLTTEDALRLEQRNLHLIRAGQRPTGRPILDRPFSPEAAPSLSPDQLRVVRHLLESRALVLAVEGKPGTGKTFTLTTVRDAAASAGWSVRAFAVTTGAVAQLRAVGLEAATLKSLAAHPPAAPSPRELWIVDEAGLLSNRDAAIALEAARRAGARLVLVGDRRQHHAVEAGRPWSSFQRAGLRPARLDAIRRQQDPVLLAAVELSAEGRAGDALRHLDACGRLREIPAARERHAAIARDFADSPRDTLIIAPSHAERRDLNFLARRELVARGQVSPKAITIEIAVSKGLTAAQRADLRHYEPGDLLTYPRAAPRHGFRAGDTARVVALGTTAAGSPCLTVQRSRDGATVTYDPRRLRGGDLARVETRELAVGDRVQFRRADRTRAVPNGALATVREAHPGRRLLLALDGPAAPVAPAGRSGGSGRSPRTLDLQPSLAPLPLDHAYAVTSHAAQGATVRRVLASCDTRHSAELLNRQQTNVTLSRATHELVVYTDDRAALPAAADRQATKTNAIDLLEPLQRPARSRPHAPPPRHRTPEPAPERCSRPAGPFHPSDRSARPDRPAGSPAQPSRTATDSAPAPGRRPRARPRGGEGRHQRPRNPRPRPLAHREPRQEPRPQRAEDRGRRPPPPAERHPPRRRERGPRHPPDPLPPRSPLERPRPPAPSLPQRLIAAVERWHAARAPRAPAASQQPAPTPPSRSRQASPPLSPRSGHPGPRSSSPRRASASPLRALSSGAAGAARATTRAFSAFLRPEDAERDVVRLVRQIGIPQALALLPPTLARAVKTLRAIARYLSGPSRDR